MLSRRNFLCLSAAVTAGLSRYCAAEGTRVLHRQILDEAARQERERRARFAAVANPADLEALQKELRGKFLNLLDGLPQTQGVPKVQTTGTIEADDYRIEKLVYESLPGYFVSALLYVPNRRDGAVPGILSPCGHSTVGKAAPPYQTLHINLAKRGYVVLTYDPVGQGERSQFWDAASAKSRYNLTCGEHAVLGNPLYLLGTNLARYRIWDGMRGLDYLVTRPEVDANRLGCVGNSGGGNLTAYIAALDRRVRVAAICCYITTLPRRMATRIQQDPDSDPEQDIYGFVSQGIDHAGLLALLAPRPTLLGTARFDFFPIEGARETFAEAQRLYNMLNAGERLHRVEANERHGLSQPLRQSVYDWFDRWLYERKEEGQARETAVEPRSPRELQVCADGQVNVTFRSRPLLTVTTEEFRARKQSTPIALKVLLQLDAAATNVVLTEFPVRVRRELVHILCINGIETGDWRNEAAFLRRLSEKGIAVTVADPRGVGKQRPNLEVKGHAYEDPLCGVEENLAYNAFLVGKSLLGMRVADAVEAARRVRESHRPELLVICGRRDAALVACFAAAVDTNIAAVAVEDVLLSFWDLFEASGRAINAASVLPCLLRDFGDMDAVLAAIGPRKVLAAAPRGKLLQSLPHVNEVKQGFSIDVSGLLEWING